MASEFKNKGLVVFLNLGSIEALPPAGLTAWKALGVS